VSLRILHIIDSLAGGGTAQQLLVLANGLARHGFDVQIAVLQAGPRLLLPVSNRLADGFEPDPGIPISVIGRRFPIDPLADARLLRYVLGLQPDVVHTWDTVPGMFGPIGARRWRQGFARRRLISGEVAIRPRFIAGRYRIERWRPAWESWLERRFARSAAQYITNSPTVRDWCIAHNGLRDHRFTFMPPGVPPAPASDVPRDELLRELQLPPDARLIGVVGRLVPASRVQDLIWAADLLRVLHDNLRLLIIGDGPLRPQLEQYARLASDLEHIRFLGERADVWRIMPHLDVLWNGSDNRSVSTSILEAMAAGVPVVASDVPVNRELVLEGETGYLFPIGSRAGRADRARHTDRIFTDASLAACLGAASRKRVAGQFSVERMVSDHAKLYRQLC